MGYTHYWYRKKDCEMSDGKFMLMAETMQRIVRATGVKVQAEYDNDGRPAFSRRLVRFNGPGDDGHETFYLPRRHVQPDWQRNKPWVFAFCKTARKPYDLPVQCCLIVAKHFYEDHILIHSDGAENEWEDARRLCQEILGFGSEFKLDSDAEVVQGDVIA